MQHASSSSSSISSSVKRVSVSAPPAGIRSSSRRRRRFLSASVGVMPSPPSHGVAPGLAELRQGNLLHVFVQSRKDAAPRPADDLGLDEAGQVAVVGVDEQVVLDELLEAA